MYEAFRKVLDFMYLDDLNVLQGAEDHSEIIEVIKLSQKYGLEALFEASEKHFKELMSSQFDCSSLI